MQAAFEYFPWIVFGLVYKFGGGLYPATAALMGGMVLLLAYDWFATRKIPQIHLVLAILVSCFTELNVGILALALAWVVGVYVGGMPLNDVIAGFPVSLFLTLSGVTLLFSQAQMNRTLDRIAHLCQVIVDRPPGAHE